MSTHHPHDHFFRLAFAKPDVAQPFCERFLPPAVVAELDLSTLKLDQESFVDPDLSGQQTDLLFRLRRRDGQDAQVYLLLEHKSYTDPWVGLQLLGYLVRIWERQRRSKRGLPLVPIIAQVVYHGEPAWSGGSTFDAIVDTTPALLDGTPRFRFGVCDLSQEQLDAIQDRAWFAITLKVLKYARSDELPAQISDILALFRQLLDQRLEAIAFLGTVTRYLAQTSTSLNEASLRQAMAQALPTDIGDEIMPTLAETWTEQGRLDGQRAMLRRQLVKKFNTLPAAVNDQIAAADQETLDHWADRLLNATSLDDIVGH